MKTVLYVLVLQDSSEPVMCSYKAVKVFFEVWGLQGRVESGVHRVSSPVPSFIGCCATRFYRIFGSLLRAKGWVWLSETWTVKLLDCNIQKM